MAKNTVYIAGPMRGYPRFNVDAFDGVAATLKRYGFSVRNPAEMDRAANVNHDAEVTSEDLRACMRRDLLAILDECSAIALLPGWEKSAGVKVELALARFLGLPVYDAVTFERIEEGDKQPAPELELMQEFTAADTELRELAMELQNRGAEFEMTGSRAVLWWKPTSCCFDGKFCRYRMVSLPPGEPATKPTISPGEEFGADTPRKGDPDENILAEAMRITAGDRQASYGPPDQDFARTAAMWSAIKGVEFEAREVALFMILLKVSRETHQRKRDNWVDIAGYAKCGSLCE